MKNFKMFLAVIVLLPVILTGCFHQKQSKLDKSLPDAKNNTSNTFTIAEQTIEELIKESEGALVGKVVEVEKPYSVGKNAEGTDNMLQQAKIQIKRWTFKKADYPDGYLTITYLPGEPEPVIDLEEGELVFLLIRDITFYEQKVNAVTATGYFQGKFRVEGAKLINRDKKRQTTLEDLESKIKTIRK